MAWNDLSVDAKNIIEWIEDPFTHKRESVCIKSGEWFRRNGHGTGDVHILVTPELFREVLGFVKDDNNLQATVSLDGELIFALRPDSNVQLH